MDEIIACKRGFAVASQALTIAIAAQVAFVAAAAAAIVFLL
ncbi:MAG: hypothetical protein WD969_01250 [Paracoccaceae bacterium]